MPHKQHFTRQGTLKPPRLLYQPQYPPEFMSGLVGADPSTSGVLDTTTIQFTAASLRASLIKRHCWGPNKGCKQKTSMKKHFEKNRNKHKNKHHINHGQRCHNKHRGRADDSTQQSKQITKQADDNKPLWRRVQTTGIQHSSIAETGKHTSKVSAQQKRVQPRTFSGLKSPSGAMRPARVSRNNSATSPMRCQCCSPFAWQCQHIPQSPPQSSQPPMR